MQKFPKGIKKIPPKKPLKKLVTKSQSKSQNNTREEEKRDEPRSRQTIDDDERQKIPKGCVFDKRYEILDAIGKGTYGQIYKARQVNKKGDDVVAIKTMVKTMEGQRSVLEQTILKQLSGRRHFPKLLNSGSALARGGIAVNYIVMELLGQNLSDLRKHRPDKHFIPLTVLRVGIQGVTALETLHSEKYLHRDIKPQNMCIGLKGERVRIVHLIDFGLSKLFKPLADLRRKYAPFKGTPCYVSTAVHERFEQVPIDDLFALYYSLCEMAEGSLPWRKWSDQDYIYQSKKQHRGNIVKNMPPEFMQVYDYLDGEDLYIQCPDYNKVRNILKNLLPKDFDEPGTPYEWEDNLPFDYRITVTKSVDKKLNAKTKRCEVIAEAGTQSDSKTVYKKADDLVFSAHMSVFDGPNRSKRLIDEPRRKL